MNTFWNERFSAEEYIYGMAPSTYFKIMIDRMKPGRLLVPGAGEGRDAVYAARLGWDVHAFDQSTAGQTKALQLAARFNVSIEYIISDAAFYDPAPYSFDLIAMVFFHLPPDLRKQLHQKLPQWLTPGGLILVEAFHKNQLNYSSGGPKDPELLVTPEILADDFSKLHLLENRHMQVVLNEGTHHIGPAEVVRMMGQG
jgi:SAM-dependent methyltransferase